MLAALLVLRSFVWAVCLRTQGPSFILLQFTSIFCSLLVFSRLLSTILLFPRLLRFNKLPSTLLSWSIHSFFSSTILPCCSVYACPLHSSLLITLFSAVQSSTLLSTPLSFPILSCLLFSLTFPPQQTQQVQKQIYKWEILDIQVKEM